MAGIKYKKAEFALISSHLRQLLGPLVVQRGSAQADLVYHWADLVGVEAAERSFPLKLTWPRGSKEATLTILVDGFLALHFQHQSKQVLERINDFLGATKVGKLKLQQMPPALMPLSRKAALELEITVPQPNEHVAALVANIEDTKLREWLYSLGCLIYQAK